MLPGPLRPDVRFDAHRRRRVRRSWVRVAPVAVPLAVLCAVLLPWLRAAPAHDPPGDPRPAATGDPSVAPRPGAELVPTARDLVVVAVTPVEPGLLGLLRPGDRVDVYGRGAAPPPRPATGTGPGGTPDPAGAPAWLLGDSQPVVRLAAAALVVVVPDGLAPPAAAGAWPGGAEDGTAEALPGPVVPSGTVALAVPAADARTLAGARAGGLDLALLPAPDG